MQAFLGILQFLLILQRVPAQMSELQKEKAPTTVIPFSEVMEKSKCQPMEHLVYVYHEFPESVDTIYIPDCVVLRRCSGYITDEAKGCYPTLERNITLQLVLFSVQQPVVGKQPVVELTFVEHQSCEHRPRQNLQNYERPVIKSQQQQVYQEQTFQEES
ncbi:snake venom vascular endothelial growth factor toxin HF-like [Archocentrus centrarchus]|uniref:snake venom vascular endothelial growth factor toxin HF-like n=1 Tax=Archocentrus centrarchus TaxID=63155 RepID=UPI0011EA4719|nr:snake venom vascular endothelial growth factor toxin HF-like [Archocentrus centrarchus]